MDILSTLADRELFGGTFAGTSWTTWRALLAAVFALSMTEALATLYCEHSGRQTPPANAAREAWLVTGRRGGKSRISLSGTALDRECKRLAGRLTATHVTCPHRVVQAWTMR